jgi:hypothetical protein
MRRWPPSLTAAVAHRRAGSVAAVAVVAPPTNSSASTTAPSRRSSAADASTPLGASSMRSRPASSSPGTLSSRRSPATATYAQRVPSSTPCPSAYTLLAAYARLPHPDHLAGAIVRRNASPRHRHVEYPPRRLHAPRDDGRSREAVRRDAT